MAYNPLLNGFGNWAQSEAKKAANKKKTVNPFLKGSGGKQMAKQVKKANRANAGSSYRSSTPKKKKSSSGGGAYGAGGKFYRNGYVDSRGNKVVNGRWVAPAKKAVAKKTTSKSKSSSSRTGGAWSRDGKRFYKNGYVDSKGNRVVNGKWQAPKASSSPVAKKKATVKKVTSTNNTVTKTSTKKATPKKKPTPIKLLGKNYQDQIYKNQIAELDGADQAYTDDNTAKVKRLTRDYKLNQANVKQNKDNSLQNSAEDFASRGMMRSGAYRRNLSETNKVFNDQTARMASNYSDDNAEYARAKSDYLRGSRTQRQEAKRQLGDRIATENSKRTSRATT